MPRERSHRKAVACPSCGSYEFNLAGCVAYEQPYNSRTESYGASEIGWDADWLHYVECANCNQDVKQLFKKAGGFTDHFKHVEFEEGRT